MQRDFDSRKLVYEPFLFWNNPKRFWELFKRNFHQFPGTTAKLTTSKRFCFHLSRAGRCHLLWPSNVPIGSFSLATLFIDFLHKVSFRCCIPPRNCNIGSSFFFRIPCKSPIIHLLGDWTTPKRSLKLSAGCRNCSPQHPPARIPEIGTLLIPCHLLIASVSLVGDDWPLALEDLQSNCAKFGHSTSWWIFHKKNWHDLKNRVPSTFF